jgi:hypothetical protein
LSQDVIGPLVEAGVEVYPPGTSIESVLHGEPAVVTSVAAPAGCWRTGIVMAATAACTGAITHPDRLDAAVQRDSKLSGRKPKA